MTNTTEPVEVSFRGRIFDGVLTLQAWSIATRILPKSGPEETLEDKQVRAGLAIAAQIGMNHGSPASDREKRLSRKLREIAQIIEE